MLIVRGDFFQSILAFFPQNSSSRTISIELFKDCADIARMGLIHCDVFMVYIRNYVTYQVPYSVICVFNQYFQCSKGDFFSLKKCI